MKKMGITALTVALLAGCSLAPKYERPDAPVAQTWPTGDAYKENKFTEAPLPNWENFFKNKRIRQVIALSLENNRDWKIALLNIEKAKAAYGIQRADLLPNISAGGSAQHSRTPSTQSASGDAYTSHVYQATLSSTAWELDLFGRVRNLTEAALQSFLATQESSYSTKNALIAEIANAWIDVGAQKELLKLAKDTLENQEKSCRLTEQSYQLGNASLLEVEQAKTTVATAKASVAEYERSLAQSRNTLSLLVGTAVPVKLEPEKLEPAADSAAIIPPDLPSEVLLRRPDIRAAERELRAANANIGVARANFFPRIRLTASIGTGSSELGSLFDSGSGFWTFAPSVSLPIFSGGANIANLRQAEAEKQIQVANYEKTIQTAFKEVSDALATEGTIKRQSAALGDLVKASRRAYSLSQSRYKNGLDAYLNVLDSQRELFSAQKSYIACEQAKYNSSVQLYKVLGGGDPSLSRNSEKTNEGKN